jgi:hypothetical protein
MMHRNSLPAGLDFSDVGVPLPAATPLPPLPDPVKTGNDFLLASGELAPHVEMGIKAMFREGLDNPCAPGPLYDEAEPPEFKAGD